MKILHTERQPLSDVMEVERSLQSLWLRARSDQESIVRSRVMTLIVVAPETEEGTYTSLLTALAGRHPARTLLVLVGDPGAEEGFDATVSLLCEIGSGALCAEQIRLHARGAALARLPAALRALVGGSLPVALWWALPPEQEARLLRPLRRTAHLVLFDSRRRQEPALLLPWIERIGTSRAADLNWERLAGWREAVARLFDPLGCRAHLTRLERVVIDHDHCPTRAWLLAGWICDRLGWEPAGSADDLLRVARADGTSIQIEIRANASNRGGLRRVVLAGPAERFELNRLDRAHVRSTIVTPGAVPLDGIGHLGHRTREEIVSALLDRMAPDPLYMEALMKVQQLTEPLS